MELLEIDRCEFIDKDVFRSEYLQGGKPLILSGFANDWPSRHWTLQSLQERVGENLVTVRRNTDDDDYKVGKKHKIEKMKLEDYIGNILKGNKKALSSYMAVQNIKQAFPQLENEIIIPDFVEKLHCGPYLWIAYKGHYEFCHFDPDDNCLVILNGRKRVRLFGCDLETMYPNKLGSRGKTIQSRVIADAPDFDRFPNFKNSKCYEVIVITE